MSELWPLGSLTVLDLERTQVGDESIESLAKLQSLHELYVADTQFTEVGINRLRGELPGATVFTKVVDRKGREGAALMR